MFATNICRLEKYFHNISHVYIGLTYSIQFAHIPNNARDEDGRKMTF